MHTFEITIQRRLGDGYPVITEEHRSDGSLPVRVEGELRLDMNEILANEINPAAYGQLLGEALFSGGVRDAFVEALARAEEVLRVLLFIEDQAMRGLRWERLHAPIDGAWKPLSTYQRAPLSRYMPSLTDRRFPPIGRRDLRALIIAASPDPDERRYKLQPFDVAAAIAGVRAALGPIPTTLLADIEGADGRPTLNELCARISAEPITILHIVCHGRAPKGGESVMFLAGDDGPGTIDPVNGTHLLERLSSLEGAHGLPHFCFLSTCESASPDADEAMGGIGQRLVHDLGMPAVVAMTDKVTIVTANALSEEIYKRLREHGEPDRALVEATARLAEHGDVMVPVLFSRLGGRPLFSDTLDRALTSAEVTVGLSALEKLLPERAPVLVAELNQAGGTLRRSLGRELEKLSPEARQERAAAMTAVESLCAEATELSFQGLCLGTQPPAYDARCPFPGLRSFKAEAKEFFFGREPLVQRLQQRIGEHPFLAVLGPSGSGKSSLIFAGLAPALQKTEPGLRLISFTPGEHPQASLSAALGQTDAGARALLVVDQFEEAFTLCQDADERKAFFEALLQLPAQHLVIITMRADFFGEVAPYPALRNRVQAHQELIAPMTPEELRRAMELQASAVGLRFEADLGGEILDDVRGEPGAMPLLQHALQELWQRRRGRWLRRAEYHNVGGIQQAIAHSADQIYDGALPEDKERVRSIFVRLTRLDSERGEGQPRDTRQRVALAELVPAGADPTPIRALVGRLADQRLLVTGVSPSGAETVEVAHEALIRSWPRLRSWLSEDRQGLLLCEAIRNAAREWSEAKQDEGFLFRGARLDEALALSKQPRFALNTREQQFIDAALALREREAAEKEQARQRELKAAQDLAAEQEQRAKAEQLRAEEARTAAGKLRQRAIYLAAAAGLALVAAIAAVLFMVGALQANLAAEKARIAAEASDKEARASREIAVVNEQAARTAEADAVHNATVAISNGLDAAVQEAISSGDYSKAIGLGLVRHEQYPDDPRALSALGEATYAPGITQEIDLSKVELLDDGNWVSAAAISPNGELVATGHYSGTMAIWNINEQTLVRQTPAEGGTVYALAFSPSGDTVAVARAETGLSISGMSSDRLLSTNNNNDPVYSVAFSPDGKLLAAGHYSGAVTFWDASNFSPIAQLKLENNLYTAAYSMAFSADNSRLLVGYSDNTARIWDVEGQSLLKELNGASDTSDNLQTRHNGAINAVAFDSSGEYAITASEDKAIGIWDGLGQSDSAYAFITGHTAAVRSVDLSLNDEILSASDDGTLRVWGLFDHRERLRLQADGEGVQGAVYQSRPEGFSALSFGNSTPPRIWSLIDGREHSRYYTDGPARDIGLSARGTLAVAAVPGGAVAFEIVDDQSGVSISNAVPFSVGNAALPLAVAVNPDGNLAATADVSGTIILWDPQTGERRGELADPKQFQPTSLAFDPQGERLAATMDDATLGIWKLADQSVTWQKLTHPADQNIPAFAEDIAWSPDGESLLLGTNWGAWIWNIDQGQVTSDFSWLCFNVHSVAFSPDSTLVALGCDNGRVYIADAQSGELVNSVKHQGPVRAVAFSPDGSRLVSVGDDKQIKIWDTAGYTLIEHIDLQSESVNGLVIEPIYNSIITSSDDYLVQIWDLFNPDELVSWANDHRYVPELSCEDLARYGLCDPSAETPTPTPAP